MFGIDKKTSRRDLSAVQDQEMVGLLEPGIVVEGKLRVTTGMIRLNTHLKGEVVSEGTVIVAEQGEIDGDIQSRVISITGKVKGTVRAAERLEIHEHGVVIGDIYTPSLVIDPGGYFDGQCRMPMPEPAKQAAEG
jgi:cytoskeletal protein CcmA (bactofilin family)